MRCVITTRHVRLVAGPVSRERMERGHDLLTAERSDQARREILLYRGWLFEAPAAGNQ